MDVSYDGTQIPEVIQHFWVTRDLPIMAIGLQNGRHLLQFDATRCPRKCYHFWLLKASSCTTIRHTFMLVLLDYSVGTLHMSLDFR